MTTPKGFTGFLSAIRARWWVVVICALIAAVPVLIARSLEEDTYEASGLVLFRSTNLDASVLNGSSYFGRSNDALRTAATNFELVQSPTVAARVAAKLGPPWSAQSVEDRMSFAEVGDSDVVKVSATDPSPEMSARLANEWIREFVAYRRETDRSQVSEAIALVEQELQDSGAAADSRTDELRRSLSQLRVVQALQTGGAEFIQPAAVPTNPAGLPLALVLAGATLVGLLIGCITAVLAERTDRRLRSPEDAAEALGLPLLASIPRLRAKDTRAFDALMAPAAREGFHTLAVRLRFFDLDSARRVMAVVSGESGEGKTSVAIGLGLAYASVGRRVIVVDCDLRRGDLRLRVPLGPGPGLAEVLSDQAALDDAIREIDIEADALAGPAAAGGVAAMSGSLSVLPAGVTPPNPIQMLSSRAMGTVLATLRASYDHVVLDTSPLLRASDAEALIEGTDGFIVVARVQTTTTEDLRQLREIVARSEDRALGVVANDVSRRDTRAGYYGVTKELSLNAGDQ